MASLDNLMQVFAKNAEKFTIPDLATKKAMTAAGAKVYTEKLKVATRERHYQKEGKKGSKRKVKHLADSISFENTDVDGIDNGNSVAGFQGKDESGVNHARIARFLNDGTVKLTGDHFVDTTRKESASAVFEAEKKILDISRGGHK